MLLFSPIHLPPIMPLDTPHRLPQSIHLTMMVIQMGCLVLMEYDHRSLLRVLRIMQIPVMPCVSAHDRRIILICGDDVDTSFGLLSRKNL